MTAPTSRRPQTTAPHEPSRTRSHRRWLPAVLSVVAVIGCSKPQHSEHLPDAAPDSAVATGDASPHDAGGLVSTQAGLKIALLGDQGVGADAQNVLRLIAGEHAQAIIHLGDLSYDDAATSDWDAQIDAVLGTDFPYFAVIGNHDVASWNGPDGFAASLAARLGRVPDAQCTGEYGVNMLCRFRGLAFVLSGVGTYGSDHEAFLDSALADDAAMFRLCIWHKNQHDMQVGAKTDEVGWPAYQICARHGVPIITGHEHSYARTRVLTAIGDRERAHGATGLPDRLELTPGATFVIVDGLGGKSSRPRTDDHATDTWWASIYAQNYQLENGVIAGTNADISYGALFLEFNVDADPHLARGYFKTVDGQTHDTFTFVVRADSAR